MAEGRVSNSYAGGSWGAGVDCRGGSFLVGGGSSDPLLADILDELGHAAGHFDDGDRLFCLHYGVEQEYGLVSFLSFI